MKKVDKLMKSYLLKEAKDSAFEPGCECLSDIELAEYAQGGLPKEKRDSAESHISECCLCLERLAFCAQGPKRKLKNTPKDLRWRAKNIDRIDEDIFKAASYKKTKEARQMEREVKKWLPKNLRKNKWLIGSITAFALSFAFPAVFFQFLLAAGILGGKWIFESQNKKTLIMIHNAWKEGDQRKITRLLNDLHPRS